MFFAQQGQFGGGGGNNADAAALILAGVCGFLLVYLLLIVLFFLTLSKALGKCSPRNRTMEPGQVWLNFIPCFNIVWQFITVIRVAESLKNEFEDRGVRRGDSYGKTLGLSMLIVSIFCNIGSRATDAMGDAGVFVAIVLGLIPLILFIAYWVKIAGYSKELDSIEPASGERRRGRDDDDDYDDRRRDDRRDDDDDDRDRPRRRRDRDD